MAIELKKGGRPTVRPSDEVLAEIYRNHTAREIADKYSVSEATVRSWIARSRKRAVLNDGK